jgi:hypothetical protein
MKNLGKISAFLLILIFTLSFGQEAKKDSLKHDSVKIENPSKLDKRNYPKTRDGINRNITTTLSHPVELKEIKLYDKNKISFFNFFNDKAWFKIDGKTVGISKGDSLAIGLFVEDIVQDSICYKPGEVFIGRVVFFNERAVYFETFKKNIYVKYKNNSDPIFMKFDFFPYEIQHISAKPIIYIYPEKETEVNVKLDYKGTFTTTYPKYPENGWTVNAKPDGALKDKSGKEYYSLFWEGETDKVFTIDEGFVVKSEDAAGFLEKSLKTLGLNFREANEFIIFWLPELEKNPYNLIHFSTKEYEELAELSVNPVPDTLIRVFMVFKGLDKPIEVKPQTLVSKVRKGFTVVEWGGSKISHGSKKIIN